MGDAFGLYLVMTDPVVGYEACAEAAVRCGVRYLQLRRKGAPRDAVLETALRVRDVTLGSDTLFIVNDDVTIAREVDADGVHLGQHDLPLAEARRMWPAPGKRFGLSTHNEQEALIASRLSPDYIGVGPVFATPTKAVPDPVLGLERMGIDPPVGPGTGSRPWRDRLREPRGGAPPRRPELLRREGGQPATGSGDRDSRAAGRLATGNRGHPLMPDLV